MRAWTYSFRKLNQCWQLACNYDILCGVASLYLTTVYKWQSSMSQLTLQWILRNTSMHVHRLSSSWLRIYKLSHKYRDVRPPVGSACHYRIPHLAMPSRKCHDSFICELRCELRSKILMLHYPIIRNILFFCPSLFPQTIHHNKKCDLPIRSGTLAFSF